MSFHSATPPTSPDETTLISNNSFYHPAPHNNCPKRQTGAQTTRTKSSLLPTPPRTKNSLKPFTYSSPSEDDASCLSSSSSLYASPRTERPSFSTTATHVSRSSYRPTMSFELAPALANGLCPPPEIVELPRSTWSKRDSNPCTKLLSVDNPFLLTSSSFTPPLCSPADSTASADARPIVSSFLDIPDYFTFSPSSPNQTLPDLMRQQTPSLPSTPLKTPPAESRSRLKRSIVVPEREQMFRNTDAKKGPIWDEANPFLEGIGMPWNNSDDSESESGSENECRLKGKSGWLKRQRFGEAHEKQTIDYVFRGAKKSFANPFYDSSRLSPPTHQSPTQSDYSPPSNPRPRLLFPPQITPRRPMISLSSRLQTVTRTSARPVFVSDADDDNDDDDDKGMLMATPRKLFTSIVPTSGQPRLIRGPKKRETSRRSLGELTPRSERGMNTPHIPSTGKELGICQKSANEILRESSVGTTKRGSESIGNDISSKRDAKRLRC